MRSLVPILAVMTIGGCAQLQQPGGQATDFDLMVAAERAYASFLAQPFEDGLVYVVAEEHGEMHTYSLTPCRGGTHICGPGGRQGHMTVFEDYVVVTGAYPGRAFYLRPGGDGALRWRGAWHPLAWD